MSNELDSALARARELYQSGVYQDAVFTELGRSSHPAAMPLFREMLSDSHAQARYTGLRSLSKTKYLSSNPELIQKIRDVLLGDSDASIRTQAAIVLGGHSKWPEPALERAVDHDTDTHTRQEALLSVLELMVSFDFADQHRGDITSGTLETSMATAHKLVAEHKQKSQK